MAGKKNPGKEGHRLAIVFAETGSNNYQVFLEGLTPERKAELKHIPEDEWSPAEFWALKMFKIVTDLMQQTGTVQEKRKKD